MTRNTMGVGLVLTFALTLTAVPALAAEGRIPVWQPITIMPGGEGRYILTRDITGGAGAPAIDIQPGTVAVEIDLNGFTIYGMNPNDVIRASGIDSLTVRNGTIMFGGGGGGQAGIYVADARKLVVEEMKIQFIDGYGIGMFDVQNFEIRRNIIVSAGQDGIFNDGYFIDPSIPVDGTIADNVVRECGGGVTIVNGASIAVENNRIEETINGAGILMDFCQGCLLAENTVKNTVSAGIDLNAFYGGKIYNNVVRETQQGEGIWLHLGSDDNLVLNNVVSRAGFVGLRIDSHRNHVEGNAMSSNGSAAPGSGWGLALNGFNNTYRGNTAHGNNGSAATCTGVPATTDFCDGTGLNTSPFNQPLAGLAGDNLMPGLL